MNTISLVGIIIVLILGAYSIKIDMTNANIGVVIKILFWAVVLVIGLGGVMMEIYNYFLN